MKWIIPMDVIERSMMNSFFIGEAGFRGNTITLYSKNTMKNYRFRNAKKSINQFAYIAERNSVPNYFKKVILPLES